MSALTDFFRRPAAAPEPAKAATGVGAQWLTFEPSVASITRSPQKRMREAQVIGNENRWIRSAERVIGQRFSTVPWHIEDQQDEEVAPEHPAVVLLEKPYTPRPGDPMSQTPRTRSRLWSITCRHMGLCNNAFWYMDGIDAALGVPNALLYINPARMTPSADDNGNLVGWVLDADQRGHGMPLERERVLHFQLEQPDDGWFGSGLVDTARTSVAIGNAADRHATGILTSGGRLAGVFSPKSDTLPPEVFAQLVRDLRVIAESPDAAKRALVLGGPIDYTRTAATPHELDLVPMLSMVRDDILGLWGVPVSQLGMSAPAGLNSGGKGGFEEAVLWQNAVGPRLDTFRETLQFECLDRFGVDLELEQPTFDDDAPKYDLAKAAVDQPITVDERRELIGMAPLDPAIYGDLGKAIYQPMNIVEVWSTKPPEPPPVVPPALVPFAGVDNTPTPDAPLFDALPAKARTSPHLRKRVEAAYTPRMRKSLEAVLAEQAAEIAARVVDRAAHLAKKPSDTDVWWNQAKWDKRLTEALQGYAEAIGDTVSTDVAHRLAGAGKANLPPNVLKKLLGGLAKRVVGINETTRDAIRALIEGNVGLGGAQLGKLITTATAFDSNRAERIARTETGTFLNQSQTASFGEYGVESVEVLDGDGDDICAEANGQTWSLEQADADPLGHPNCLVPETPVIAPNLRASFTRWYEGDVVTIKTAGGHKLSGTPNHPVLTRRGWVALGSVSEGDYVVRGSDVQRVARSIDPDHDHMEARIAQIAESLPMVAPSVPAAAEDFHGDAADGDVYVVRTHGLLQDGHKATFAEPSRELASAAGDVLRQAALAAQRAAVEVFIGALHAAHGGVSIDGQTPAQLWIGGVAVGRVLVTGPLLDTSAAEPYTKAGTVPQADAGSDDVRALAGLIALDEVVSADRAVWAGHVYNLETRQGWYFADSIVTHNCTRDFAPVLGKAATPPVSPPGPVPPSPSPFAGLDFERLGHLVSGLKGVQDAMTTYVTNTIQLPDQPAPVVNVTVEAAKAADVTVNVPKQPAPIVNVTTPDVTVTVPEAKALGVQDIRIVEMPAPPDVKVTRDPQGRINGVETR